MKGKLGLILGSIAVIAIIFGIWWILTSDSITKLNNQVERKYADIQTNLQRRFDLIPNAVENVKGYVKHEEKVFTEIAEARAKLGGTIKTGTAEEMIKANNEYSASLGRLLALQENYPQLEAQSLFKELSDIIEGTENRINIARQDYNEAVTVYNDKIQTFPGYIIAGQKGLKRIEPFKADEKAQEAPKVEF